MKNVRQFISGYSSLTNGIIDRELLKKTLLLYSGYFSTKEGGVDKRREELMAKGLPKRKNVPGVKNIFLVVSGKGGVGKSTIAVNIATSMANKNIKVGLLDADVYGPSVPLMMNLNDTPLLNERNKMVPLVNYGVKCMSMGFLISESSAVIWRGLMVMSALDRLMWQVDWSDTDYLVIDTPPGTGDTLLSLMQNIPITGVIMVTTPHRASVQVARRGATMLQKLGVPVVGIVSNMSTVICPNCKESLPMFGEETKQLASELGLPILAEIPLDEIILQSQEKGLPVILANPDGLQAQIFDQLVDKIVDFHPTSVSGT